jgi:hypothetical protein
MNVKKNIGIQEPEWLNPEEPKYHCSQYKCYCEEGKEETHWLRLPYPERPSLQDKLEIECPSGIKIIEPSLDFWIREDALTSIEKKSVVEARIIKC